VTYFFWWATALSAHTAVNGIGPHYYVMSFVPMAILAADGFVRIARRRAALGVAVAVLAVAATAWNVPDKVDDAQFATGMFRPVHEALDRDHQDSVVFIASPDVQQFTNFLYPFVRNPPDLDGPVLYANDRHGENARLLEDLGRTGYLLHRERDPGDDIFEGHWALTRLAVSRGRSARLALDVSVPDGVGPDGFRLVVLDGDRQLRSTPLTRDGLIEVDVPADELGSGLHDLRVGIEDSSSGEQWLRLYRTPVDEHGVVRVVHPGTGEHVVDLGKGPVTLPEDVRGVVDDVPG
jgi:hypothetical protein